MPRDHAPTTRGRHWRPPATAAGPGAACPPSRQPESRCRGHPSPAAAALVPLFRRSARGSAWAAGALLVWAAGALPAPEPFQCLSRPWQSSAPLLALLLDPRPMSMGTQWLPAWSSAPPDARRELLRRSDCLAKQYYIITQCRDCELRRWVGDHFKGFAITTQRSQV